jgi:hypothetical protein
VFRQTVKMAQYFNLIGGTMLKTAWAKYRTVCRITPQDNAKHVRALRSIFKLKYAIFGSKSSFFKRSFIKVKNYNYFAIAA